MDKERFTQIDRWLTETLRYGSTILLTLDELHRRAANQQFEKQELLWVAFTASKRIQRGASIYRYEVDRTETGIFVGLNDESEDARRNKRRRKQQRPG